MSESVGEDGEEALAVHVGGVQVDSSQVPQLTTDAVSSGQLDRTVIRNTVIVIVVLQVVCYIASLIAQKFVITNRFISTIAFTAGYIVSEFVLVQVAVLWAWRWPEHKFSKRGLGILAGGVLLACLPDLMRISPTGFQFFDFGQLFRGLFVTLCNTFVNAVCFIVLLIVSRSVMTFWLVHPAERHYSSVDALMQKLIPQPWTIRGMMLVTLLCAVVFFWQQRLQTFASWWRPGDSDTSLLQVFSLLLQTIQRLVLVYVVANWVAGRQRVIGSFVGAVAILTLSGLSMVMFRIQYPSIQLPTLFEFLFQLLTTLAIAIALYSWGFWRWQKADYTMFGWTRWGGLTSRRNGT